MLAHRIGERQLATSLCVGSQRCGERLADRANLEERVIVDRLPVRPCCRAIIEDVAPPGADDAHRHTGHIFLLHQRPDTLRDDGLDAVRLVVGCSAVCWEKQADAQSGNYGAKSIQ